MTVTYQETGDTVSYTDEIWVYVRPEVKYESADGSGTANGQIVNSDVYSPSLVVRQVIILIVRQNLRVILMNLSAVSLCGLSQKK